MNGSVDLLVQPVGLNNLITKLLDASLDIVFEQPEKKNGAVCYDLLHPKVLHFGVLLRQYPRSPVFSD